MIVTQLAGVQQILRNMKRKQEQIGVGFERGVKQAGLLLQRESQRLVPVNFGNLKASAFTRAEGAGVKTKVVVGYTAAYALFVHEAPMILKGQPRPKGRGKYWDPQGRGQNKFLEEPARRLGPQLLAQIRKNISIT